MGLNPDIAKMVTADGDTPLGTDDAPFVVKFVGDVTSFGLVNASLAAANAAVDLNSQGLTSVASVNANGALAVGGASATTSMALGRAAVAPSLPGGATVAASKAITGSGAMAIEATGALTVAGAASTTSSLIGRASNLTTMVGDTRFSGDVQAASGDGGAAGTTGTVNKNAGTFTLASGSAAFTLTNSKIASTSHVFVSCETSTVAAYIKSVAPGSGSCVITMSANVGADSKFHFFVVNA